MRFSIADIDVYDMLSSVLHCEAVTRRNEVLLEIYVANGRDYVAKKTRYFTLVVNNNGNASLQTNIMRFYKADSKLEVIWLLSVKKITLQISN